MRIQHAIDLFDLKEYIEISFPDYKETSNPEIVRVPCPFCADYRPRLYFNLEKKLWYCQHCALGRGETLINFLMRYEDKNRIQVIQDLLRLLRPSDDELDKAVASLTEDRYVDDAPDQIEFKSIELPKHVHRLYTSVNVKGPIKNKIERLQKEAKAYLKKRMINGPLAYRHKIHICYAGRHQGRILFPAFMNGIRVSWVSRKLKDNSIGQRYLNPENVDQGTVLWNFDNARIYSEVVLCEGVMDALRVGDSALAAFGKNITSRQLDIIEEYWEKAVLLLDPDAFRKAYKIAREMVIPVRVALLQNGKDAGDTDREELLELIENAPLLNSLDDFGQKVRTTLAEV